MFLFFALVDIMLIIVKVKAFNDTNTDSYCVCILRGLDAWVARQLRVKYIQMHCLQAATYLHT